MDERQHGTITLMIGKNFLHRRRKSPQFPKPNTRSQGHEIGKEENHSWSGKDNLGYVFSKPSPFYKQWIWQPKRKKIVSSPSRHYLACCKKGWKKISLAGIKIWNCFSYYYNSHLAMEVAGRVWKQRKSGKTVLTTTALLQISQELLSDPKLRKSETIPNYSHLLKKDCKYLQKISSRHEKWSMDIKMTNIFLKHTKC